MSATEVSHIEAVAGKASPAFGDDVAWTVVCKVDQVRPDRGVAVLVGDQAIAIFRLSPESPSGPEEWRAVSHIDPATGAPVIARGLVGSVGDGPIVIPTVASPLHKQRYNLRTGYCLDDDSLRLQTHEVRVRGDVVETRCPKETT